MAAAPNPLPSADMTRVANGAKPSAAWALLAVAVLTVTTGCGQSDPTSSTGAPNGKLRVAVSIVPQAWLVEQIGGARVEVLTLVQPGDSPATYQPSDAQISQLMRAAVFFRIGVPFENGPWFAAVSGTKTLDVVDMRRGIKLRRVTAPDHDDHGHGHDGDDPHIWLSPPLLKQQAQTVADALCRLDPDHAGTYRANLIAAKTVLEVTDRAVRERLAPLAGRAFLVFHPSWGYFADAYGLEQVAIEVDGKAPSDHELTAVVTAARRHGVKVIFVQPQIAGSAARAVARLIGGRVEQLDPLAADVPANLLRVADVLAESYR